MTSEERRERRYQRRKAKREEKRKEKLKKYTFDHVISTDSLYKAAYEAAKGIRWKASVQRYLIHITVNTGRMYKKLINGEEVRRGFICFDIIERGKLRHIKSVHFTERVVQKTLCKNALYPILTNSLIYDNGASQKGKGMKFAADRFIKHLASHVRRYGREGYILFIDFKDYFGNVDHEAIWRIYEKQISDERLRDFAFLFVKAFDKGLGLGSETSQINAVALRNRSDHYAKEVLRLKYYDAYMDDTAIIHKSRDYLLYSLSELEKIYAEDGIIVNHKKTKICDLKHGFTYLKTRYYVTESGRIIKKPCREAITTERRKLKKQAALVKRNEMTMKNVQTSYQSWRGSMKRRDAHNTVMRMDALYKSLFTQEESL